jgi:hypothetical protein
MSPFYPTFSVQTVEGTELELNGLSRSDMGAYLCIASNGIPPQVSKRIMVHIHCKNKITFPTTASRFKMSFFRSAVDIPKRSPIPAADLQYQLWSLKWP